MDDNNIELNPITMQRLKTIALVKGIPPGKMLDRIVKTTFFGMKSEIESFFKKIDGKIPDDDSGKIPSKIKRETDVFVIPDFPNKS